MFSKAEHVYIMASSASLKGVTIECILPIGHSVLLFCIQTLLSYKLEIIFN